jgi:hypothetical protein
MNHIMGPSNAAQGRVCQPSSLVVPTNPGLADGICASVQKQRERFDQITVAQVADLVLQSIGNEREVVRHPLGFVRVPLPGLCDSISDVNLHIWPPGLKLNDGNDIHYHVFQMRSRVLAGGLTDIQYGDQEVSRDTEGSLWQYRVSYDHANADHVMQNSGISVALSELRRETLGPGGKYCVPRGVYHRTELLPNVLTLTLIERWGHKHDLPCFVLCQPGSQENFVYEPKLVTWDAAWSLMNDAAQELQRAAQHT